MKKSHYLYVDTKSCKSILFLIRFHYTCNLYSFHYKYVVLLVFYFQCSIKVKSLMDCIEVCCCCKLVYRCCIPSRTLFLYKNNTRQKVGLLPQRVRRKFLDFVILKLILIRPSLEAMSLYCITLGYQDIGNDLKLEEDIQIIILIEQLPEWINVKLIKNGKSQTTHFK